MDLKYPNLFQPIKVRGVVFKNRLLSSASTPHFLQGTEKNPTEKIITHFANRAKSGAASISINHMHQDGFPFPGRAIDDPPGHFNLFEIGDYNAQNYFCQLLDAIHFYGAKANAYLMPVVEWIYPDGKMPPEERPLPPFEQGEPEPMSSEREQMCFAQNDGPPMMPLEALTPDRIRNYCTNIAREAQDAVRLGFDVVSVYSCYRNSFHARLLSPLTNTRTDEYGKQTVETRSRLIREIFQEIRKSVGNQVPLEVVISVDDPEGGATVEDTIEFCKLVDGLIDIIHLRSRDMDPQHPLGFTSAEEEPEPYLEKMGRVCKAVHELGLNMVVAASAGFFDPARAEQAVADGQADLVYMARSWLSNPDYGKLVFEGKDDEIVPCIRCNKCHVPNGKDMWRSFCSVNPVLGFEDKLDRMISEKPEKAQKVAVIGGGPAGMEFARIATQRGHSVTLYEASDRLGGQLKHADYPSFKWPLKQFKNFMVAQMDKLGVDVRLNTSATPELLADQGYDVIVAAMGARPSAPPIPGIDGKNVHFAALAYGGMEQELSDDIVLIGGGEIGVETALYLCEIGKKVHVLEQLPELIADAPHAHYKNMVHNYWMNQPNFTYQCGVRVTSIDEEGVSFVDHKGQAHKRPCGDVLVAIGSTPLSQEAMAFAGIANRLIVIGDCDGVASVQKAMRTAWSQASTL